MMILPSPPPRRSLVVLDESECRSLLGTTTVGQLAFVDADGQQLIPANFAFLDGIVYFRTKPDGVLGGLAQGHEDVAFGVHHHDVFREGWNVTVRGPAAEVVDRTTIDLVLGHHRLAPWAGGVRALVVKVTPRSIQGRRVSGNTS
jgi:nitroimidazol reductase NimA-like FMN-containing flavoprotein (pyridoxamine 5'-phosphate oxidase superfamily)